MLKLVVCKFKKFYMIFVVFLLIFSIYNTSTIADEKGRPDLIVYDVDLPGSPPGYIKEGDEVEFIVRIQNIKDPETGEKGNISAGIDIVVALIIDDSLVTTNSTSEGLSVDEIKFVNLSWTVDQGENTKREISIEVDFPYPGHVSESHEDNNFLDGFIYISEKNPGLEIINVDIPDTIIINQTVVIKSTIKNNGGTTNDTIYAKLNSSVDGEVQNLTRTASLARNKTHVFSFRWKPSQFGSQKLSIDIVYKGKTHDFEEISVIVEVEYLQWWNDNWHYRYFLSVEGSGNVEVSFNFTQLLKDIGVFSKSFENETLRIVKYSPDGNYSGEILKYIFKEGAEYNSVTNAFGKLLWEITGSSFEKFYCIYFDVSENIGSRTTLDETSMSASGNASVGEFGFVNGWGVESVSPINGSFAPIGKSISITVKTNVKAENVTAHIYLKDNNSINFYVYLFNTGGYTTWKSSDFSFDEAGDWIIAISSRDWADYSSPEIRQAFFVGKPDVEIKNISISTIFSDKPTKIYINDVINITAGVVCYDANFEDLNISLKIVNIKTKKTVYEQTIITTIYMDIANYVTFNWKVDISGKFNITIKLDPDNLIDEKNEKNNKLVKTLTVIEIPDLTILDIIIPSIETKEFDRIKIDVLVENKGLGDATDYKINLYVESEEQGIMKYIKDVYSTLIDVESNSNGTIGMYWNSAKPGNWLVGAKILVNDTNRDTDITNNRFLCDDILKVKPIERNPPNISNILIQPSRQVQGGVITIAAIITDETGLESVYINITNPNGKVYSIDMGRTVEDEFRVTFTDTDEVGIYSYEIFAIDITIYENTATSEGNFTINRETIPPIITFFDAEPRVQLIGESLDITCLASDNVEIKSVKVTITTPSAEIYDRNMEFVTEEKYVYSSTYDTPGKYRFQIEVSDKSNNVVNSESKSFFITSNIDDKDDDGIPDWWEEKYGMDPEDPSDAKSDPDEDGYSNLEEYKKGTNPNKDIFSENAVNRIKENSVYLSGSIIMFLFIFILSIFSKRRKLL